MLISVGCIALALSAIGRMGAFRDAVDPYVFDWLGEYDFGDFLALVFACVVADRFAAWGERLLDFPPYPRTIRHTLIAVTMTLLVAWWIFSSGHTPADTIVGERDAFSVVATGVAAVQIILCAGVVTYGVTQTWREHARGAARWAVLSIGFGGAAGAGYAVLMMIYPWLGMSPKAMQTFMGFIAVPFCIWFAIAGGIAPIAELLNRRRARQLVNPEAA